MDNENWFPEKFQLTHVVEHNDTHLEVLINENSPKESFLELTSLIDGNKKYLPLENILFINKLVDSCGMASHKHSPQLIWTAYKEYFERQSFITNYLFQIKRDELVINGVSNLTATDAYIKNYVEDIRYYNISLSKEIYAVLAIGYGKLNKAV